MTAYFTHVGTDHLKDKNRVVNYGNKHDRLAKPKKLTATKYQSASDELVSLVDKFIDGCTYNESTATVGPDGKTHKGVRFKYKTGECKQEGFAVVGIYRMDMQGFADDAGRRANIALQWGKGNDGVKGGAAGSVLVECGVDFRRVDLLSAMIRSINNQAKVYLSKTKHKDADEVAKEKARDGATVWYSSAPVAVAEMV